MAGLMMSFKHGVLQKMNNCYARFEVFAILFEAKVLKNLPILGDQ
jgi:hypothetical protein